jgi:prepilin-type N-terminal cleavage/methylation domain-containing protein
MFGVLPRLERRGFTVAEVLVVMALLGFLVTMTLVQFRGSKNRASNDGVAEIIAAQLRSARNLADAKGYPVGVFFPKTDGAQFGQGLYVIAGHSNPVLVRSWNGSGDHPDSQIFTGFWNTLARVEAQELTPTEWGAARPDDAGVIFHPDGSISSQIPSFDGGVHIVVGSNMVATFGSLSGIPSAQLSGILKPSTVTVSRSGVIATQTGLPSPAGVAMESDRASGLDFQLPTMADRPPAVPRIRTIKGFPEPVDETLPPGIDAVVHPKSTLTLTCRAVEPTGEQLTCRWESDRGGGFSTQTTTRMLLDDGIWTSVFEWGPPATALPDEIYTLTCTVTSESGASATGTLGAAGKVQILPRGRLAFLNDRDGDREVYTTNIDGTDLRQITHDTSYDSTVRWSRDGSKLFFISTRSGRSEVYIAEPDGSNVRQLTNGPLMGLEQVNWPAPSPDGNRVGFLGMRGGQFGVYVITTEGTNPNNPSSRQPLFLGGSWGGDPPTGFSSRGLVWHPNGDFLIAGGGPQTGGSEDLFQVPARALGPHLNLTAGLGLGQRSHTEPDLSPDGNRIAFFSEGGLFVADYSPGSITNVRDLGTTVKESPMFSPDGNRFTLQARNGSGIKQVYTMTVDGRNIRKIHADGTGGYDSSAWTLR